MNNASETTSLAELRESLLDKNFLPTEAQVKAAFPQDNDYLGINMEWKKFCGEEHIYQLLTREMVSDLANHLIQKANEILTQQDPKNSPVTILELGAGDGRLAHFLREELKKQGIDHAIQVVATDDMSWKAKGGIAQTDFPVESLNAEEAVNKYGKTGRTILLSSWMPRGVSWTTDFLPSEHVDGFYLIGDADSTGNGEETWSPDGYRKEDLIDDIKGNFGTTQDSPHSENGKPKIRYISKQKEEN